MALALVITDPAYAGDITHYDNGEPVIGLRDPNRRLRGQIDHIATIWETTRKDNSFKKENLVTEGCYYGKVRGEGDRENLCFKYFPDVILDPNETYFARAYVLLDKGNGQGGWSIVSNIAIVQTEEENNLTKTNEFPTKISPPIISTSCPQMCHGKAHFSIKLDGYSVVGTSALIAATYVIQKPDGEIIWHKVEDKLNATEILVDNITLEEGKIYLVKAMFHSSTGDSSQMSSYPIFIRNTTDIAVNENLIGINNAEDKYISLFTPRTVQSVEFDIIAYRNNLYKKVYTGASTSNTIIIPANMLVSGQSYLLKMKTDHSRGYRYEELTGYSSGNIVDNVLNQEVEETIKEDDEVKNWDERVTNVPNEEL